MTVEFNNKLQTEEGFFTTAFEAKREEATSTAASSSSKVEARSKLQSMESEKAKSMAQLAKTKAAATLEAQRALRRTSLLRRNSST